MNKQLHWIFFLLFSLLIPGLSFGQGVVTKILSSKQLLVELKHAQGFTPEEKVLILSQKGQTFLAFAKILSVHSESVPMTAKLEVIEIVDNSLVSPGDLVDLATIENIKDYEIPGFNSLTLSSNRKIPAKYKELAYLGVFTSEGQTLERHETLVSPFELQYGVSDKFGIKVVNALWLDKYVNAGLKYQVLSNKYAKLTLNGFGAYKVQQRDWIGQFGGVLTLPQNAKFQNHITATFTFDPQFDRANVTNGLGLFQDSDVRNITEYVMDNWHRLLFGPAYNFELQTFGGTFSYMYIGDYFHMSLGVATRNFAEFTIGKNGYYYVYDVFWRF